MAKLWDKGVELNALIERFTVGNDYVLDQRLIAADAVASMAHVQMLGSIGILTNSEVDALSGELRSIATEGETGSFPVQRSEEDGHTAIENRLTERLGDLGKKVHTGRSRNDQVLASTRLFFRDGILAIRSGIHEAARALLTFAEVHSFTPMPGRTHLQPAMPSTVGLWAASYVDLLLDDDWGLDLSYRLLNRSPLGAAAGYGVPLPLDRDRVAESLGFNEIQLNVIAVNNSRGKSESVLLDAIEQVAITLGRFATDLILFSMPEFGYFRLPSELCTGSSIMPQKQNPDGLELMRAKVGVLGGLAGTVKNVVRNLPSGYNRDVQETKEPVMRAIDTILDMLAVATITAQGIEVDRARLESGFSPGIMATDEVFKLVQAGESFRDAYRLVAEKLSDVPPATGDFESVAKRRTSRGAPGNPGLDLQAERLAERENALGNEKTRVHEAVRKTAGGAFTLFKPLYS